MPYYEYLCTECDHAFEEYRKATDPPLKRCPRCKGKVRKVFRPVGIIFKGSGFHSTDYGVSGPNGEAKKPESTGSKAGSKESSS